MKILQIISSSATSGAERHVIDLSIQLRDKGHDVQILCPSDGWLPQLATDNHLKVTINPMKGSGWWKTVGKIVTEINNGNVDIIHSHLTRAAYIGFTASRIGRRPLVTSVHIANNDAIYNRIARKRNRLVAVSGFVHGMLHGRGISEKYIDTVYNGTDFLDFPLADSTEVRAEFSINSGAPLIGLFGRVSPDKGQFRLLEAIRDIRKRVPDIHALLVGRFDGGYEEEIKQVANEMDLRNHVTFTGLRHDVPRLIDACDVVTMPSRIETFGLAAIEAMARSKPVVASRVGALPEIVADGTTGILYDLESGKLAESIEFLIDRPRIREEMGACGRNLVQEMFSLATTTARIEEVYSKTQRKSIRHLHPKV